MLLGRSPLKVYDTAVFEEPVTGLGTAVTTVPYAVVSPYSKVTTVLLPFAFTVPFNTAPVEVTDVAALVVTVAGTAGVVNVISAP